MSRASSFRRGTPETLGLGNRFAEISQAAVAERRLGKVIVVNVDPRPFGGFRFHLADRFLERQSFARYIGFVQRRLHTAQL